MVKRSQRSLHPGKAAEMKATLRTFQWEVRKWCGEIPLGTTVYVALQSLADALNLADMQLNGALDDAKRDAGGYGKRGLEDF
ncbi:hypothetical protein ACWIGM_05080 [Bosea sp. NPDC055332]